MDLGGKAGAGVSPVCTGQRRVICVRVVRPDRERHCGNGGDDDDDGFEHRDAIELVVINHAVNYNEISMSVLAGVAGRPELEFGRLRAWPARTRACWRIRV